VPAPSSTSAAGPKRRVVLVGKGTLAIRIADWFLRSPDYQLVAIVPVIPEPSWTESLASWASQHDVPWVRSGHYRDLDRVHDESWRVDLAMSVFYGHIIRPWFIAKCDRIWNLHNGPLPRYRGISPVNWALKNGEREHGVTIHEITPGVDDGPIVGQLKYSIYPEFDEVGDVYQRALEYGWVLFQQTIPLADRITPRPQDEAQATYYSREHAHLLGDRRSFTRAESLLQPTTGADH
ncbi:MAG: formyltransferase family protein, partial [Sphaerobacter sp.]|nr:formyltransferase family protein [Sphaerobacter sp.]